MSGGVDSAVAAALLVEQGYDVTGVMLHLWSEPGEGVENRCCTPHAVKDARRVARALDVPFHVLNCARRFKAAVVDLSPPFGGFEHGLNFSVDRKAGLVQLRYTIEGTIQ